MIAHAGVADDGWSAIEEALAKPERSVRSESISALEGARERHRAQLGFAHEFQCARPANHIRGMIGQRDGAIDHRGQLVAPEGLKRDPEFQGVEAAAGEQGICDQIGNAFFFVAFRVE